MSKITYGLSALYYAKATLGTDGTLTYATPVAMTGAVSMSLEAQGEDVDEYADDGEWYSENVNNGYSGTLEVEELPDSFKTDILGELEGKNGGLFETAEAEHAEFALLGQFKHSGGTTTGKRFCMFRCTASRPAVSGSTKTNTKTPQHESINIKAMARISDGMVKCTAVSTDAAYSTFFTTVPSYTAKS